LSGTEFLGLRSTTNTTVEFTEGDDLLVFGNVVKVSISLAQLQTLDGNSDFVGVLELLELKIYLVFTVDVQQGFFLKKKYLREHGDKNLWTWQLHIMIKVEFFIVMQYQSVCSMTYP
jgi:hypothetical protein